MLYSCVVVCCCESVKAGRREGEKEGRFCTRVSFISDKYAVSIPWIVRLACRASSSTAVSAAPSIGEIDQSIIAEPILKSFRLLRFCGQARFCRPYTADTK